VFIKQITIEGVEGDVEILHTPDGATVSCDGRVLCTIGTREDRQKRYAKAKLVAKVICGRTKGDEPVATNSMIHEVLDEISRVAGC
jgi:hypothetical protein